MANNQKLVNKEEDSFLSDVMGLFFVSSIMVGVMITFLPQLMKLFGGTTVAAQGYYASQGYVGALDPRTLIATEVVQWQNLLETGTKTPWVAADLYNYGPDLVNIGINTPGPWSPLQPPPPGSPTGTPGESLRVSMVGASRRIEVIFYKCDTGKTASVRVVGKY